MTQQAPAARVAGAAAVITVLTVVARIAGFGRTIVFNNTVGTHGLGSIYNAANQIPNIVFELVAGGALASLVVPLLAGAVADGDRERVNQIASALLTWVLALMVPAAILVALLAGPLSSLLDVPAAHQAVAASMLRVFAPQLPLYGIGIVLTGVLQAHHRFAWPVIAPLLSSVTVMGAYLSYALVDGAQSDFRGLTRTGELILSGGTTAGVVVLALCLIIPLRRVGLRVRPTFGFPGDEGRQAVRLGWAGAVTVGSQQVMALVVIGVTASDAALAIYVNAQTMFLLPWALLAVPLSTAVYPRLAAAVSRGDHEGYSQALANTARPVILLAGLGAAALAGLAGPAAVLVHAAGAAPGITGFAPGLFGYALFALLSRALYAKGATAAAAAATAIGWAVASVAALLVPIGGPGLGLANSLGMTVIGVLLVLAVHRHAGPAALHGLPRAAVVGIVAAGLAALAGRGTVAAVAHLTDSTPGFGISLLQGILGGIAVALSYLLVAGVLAGPDLRDLARPLTRRLRRRTREETS